MTIFSAIRSTCFFFFFFAAKTSNVVHCCFSFISSRSFPLFFFSIASSFLHHLSLTRQSLGDFDFQRSNDRKDTSHCVFFFLACYTEARSKVSATRLCLFILISLRSFYIFIRSSAMHYKPTLVFQFPENTFTFFLLLLLLLLFPPHCDIVYFAA